MLVHSSSVQVDQTFSISVCIAVSRDCFEHFLNALIPIFVVFLSTVVYTVIKIATVVLWVVYGSALQRCPTLPLFLCGVVDQSPSAVKRNMVDEPWFLVVLIAIVSGILSVLSCIVVIVLYRKYSAARRKKLSPKQADIIMTGKIS